MQISKKTKVLFSIILSTVIFINATTTINIKKGSAQYHKLASSGGIVGYSASGCSCHGGTASPSVVVSVSGMPTSQPIAGTTYALTLNITGNNALAGYNLSTSNGTLSIADAESQIIGGELTQTAPKPLSSNTTSFNFNWTPATTGAAALNYAVNNVDGTGGTGNDNWNIGVTNVTVQTLPVTLLSFKAKYENQSSIINWEVENETNFRKYDVETSCNGTDFSFLTSIAANNTTTRKSYAYTDNQTNCNSSKIYYRLKLVDQNNSFTYSKITHILKDIKKQTFKLNTNIVDTKKDALQLITNSKLVNYTIINSTGKMIQKGSIANNTILINNGLQPGIYYVSATFINGIAHTEKLIVK
jgi:hypothetical protein